MKKNKFNLIALIIVLVLLITACTQNTTPEPDPGTAPDAAPDTNNSDTGNNTDNANPDSVITKEIPESFPEEIVPLYEVDAVEGIISVGEEYHQAYFYSNTSREDLLEMYEEYFANKDVEIFQNDFSYELSGIVDGNKIRMYIMPFNEEDTSAVTTSSEVTTQDTTEEPATTTEPEVITDNDMKRYATTVIIFIYADDTANTQQ